VHCAFNIIGLDFGLLSKPIVFGLAAYTYIIPNKEKIYFNVLFGMKTPMLQSICISNTIVL